MFIALSKIKNVTATPSYPVSLVDIDTDKGLLIYEIDYSFDQISFLKNNVSKVVISVYNDEYSKDFFPNVDSKSTVEAISKYIAQKKDKQSTYEKTQLLARTISAAGLIITDEVRKELKKNQDYSIIKNKLVLKRVSEITQTSLLNPLLGVGRPDKKMSGKIDTQKTFLNLLQGGIDPSDVPAHSPQNVNPFTGMANNPPRPGVQENINVDKYLEKLNVSSTSKFIKDLNQNDLTMIKEDIEDNTVSVTEIVGIPIEDISFGTVYIKLELLDERNVPVDVKIIKKDNIIQDIDAFTTPSTELDIKGTITNNPNALYVNIGNIDKNTKNIAIFKKVLDRYDAKPALAPFVSVGNINVNMVKAMQNTPPGNTTNKKLNDNIKFYLGIPKDNVEIYRFVQIGYNSKPSTGFSTYVYTPRRPELQLVSGLVTTNLDEGVELFASSRPPNAVAWAYVKRDLTTHQHEYKQISQYFVNGEQEMPFIDKKVNEDSIYEYAVKLVTKNPTKEFISLKSRLHKRIKTNVNPIVDINISSPTVTPLDERTYDVTFSLESAPLQSTLEIVYQQMIDNGINTFFADELEERKEQFGELIAFKVTRENMFDPSDVVDFDITFSTQFIDSEASMLLGVEPPLIDNEYKYIVTPYLRFPEQILEQLSSNKAKPLFKHNNSKYGNISTPDTISKYYSNDPFAFGQFGVEKTVNVKYAENVQSNIPPPNPVRYDKRHVLLPIEMFLQDSGGTTGNPAKDIDHILIYVENSGRKKFLGKVHTLSTVGPIQYMHKLSATDFGTLRYVLHVVFKDYQYTIRRSAPIEIGN